MNKYHLTTRFKLVHSASGLALSVPYALLLYLFWKLPLFNLFALALLGFTIISSIYWIEKEHITVSEKELEYQGPEVAFKTNWENVEKISSGWHFPARIEGLTVDRSSVRYLKIAAGTVKRFPFWCLLNMYLSRLPVLQTTGATPNLDGRSGNMHPTFSNKPVYPCLSAVKHNDKGKTN